MNKKELSERNICTKFITPALRKAMCDINKQVREEVTFAPGKICLKGNLAVKGKLKRTDYILCYKPNIPLAVIEAKDKNHPVGDGIQQSLDNAIALDVPFAYSSNGDGFLENDRTITKGQVEREFPLNSFPSPDELWQRYIKWKSIPKEIEPIITRDYYYDPSGKAPRYYQQVAINRTIEAIAKGQNRILIVMATGTGKTRKLAGFGFPSGW